MLAKTIQYWRDYGFIALVVLCSTLIQVMQPDSNLLLRYQNNMAELDQWWRLLSGNFAHLGWEHLMLNASGLILMAVLFRNHFTFISWFLTFLICGTAVGGGLLIFNPELIWYVGLSGVLHGIWGVGAWLDIRQGINSGFALLLVLIGKLAWEQYSGADIGLAETIGGNVVVDAHLYGGVAGLLLGALFYAIRLTPERRSTRSIVA